MSAKGVYEEGLRERPIYGEARRRNEVPPVHFGIFSDADGVILGVVGVEIGLDWRSWPNPSQFDRQPFRLDPWKKRMSTLGRLRQFGWTTSGQRKGDLGGVGLLTFVPRQPAYPATASCRSA